MEEMNLEERRHQERGKGNDGRVGQSRDKKVEEAGGAERHNDERRW